MTIPLSVRRGGIAALMVAATFGVASSPANAASPRAQGSGTYLVGVSEPMTGAEAQAGTEIYDGELLAAQRINAHGGVLGSKIVLKEEDDACDPQTSVNAANKLVSLGVKAMVGGYCSSAAQPAESIYARAGIPNIQSAANSTTLTQGGFHNVFLVDPGGNLQAKEAANFFTKILKTKKLVIADDQSTYAVNVAQLTAAALKHSSVGVLPIQAVPNTTQDFSAVINTIRSDNAGAVYWTGYFAQAAEFVRQLRQAGLHIPFVTADGSVDPTFIKDAGAAAQGTYATISVLSSFLTGPAARSFDAGYLKEFHAPPGPYSAYGYDGVLALANAAKKAHSLAPAKVIAALHHLKFQGLTGSVSFAPNGARLGAHFVVLQVRNGAYHLAPRQP
ncbi:MAG: branched-chain amino acid ABC transporter substrate-binding protein [Actinomycetota bacterium]|nr:branched-chain amino acid ABC transporter substrate-binding protein [Actinomycetota bacterium]